LSTTVLQGSDVGERWWDI